MFRRLPTTRLKFIGQLLQVSIVHFIQEPIGLKNLQIRKTILLFRKPLQDIPRENLEAMTCYAQTSVRPLCFCPSWMLIGTAMRKPLLLLCWEAARGLRERGQQQFDTLTKIPDFSAKEVKNSAGDMTCKRRRKPSTLDQQP